MNALGVAPFARVAREERESYQRLQAGIVPDWKPRQDIQVTPEEDEAMSELQRRLEISGSPTNRR